MVGGVVKVVGIEWVLGVLETFWVLVLLQIIWIILGIVGLYRVVELL